MSGAPLKPKGGAAGILPRGVRRALSALALCLADLAAVAAAAGASWLERRLLARWIEVIPVTFEDWALCAGLLFVAVASVFLARGLYSRHESLWESVRLAQGGALVALLLSVAAVYLWKEAERLPRSFAILSGFNLVLGIPFARLAAIRLLRGTRLWTVRVRVAGREEEARRLAVELERDFALGYEVVEAAEGEVSGAGVDEVVISAAGLPVETVARWAERAHADAASVTVLPDLGGIPFATGRARFLFDDRRILLTTENRLALPHNRVLKRGLDLALAGAGVILLLPLLAFLGLLVKLGSPGPVLVSQARLGRRGRTFQCLKFRTMVADAEAGLEEMLRERPELKREWDEFQKLRDDPRVTPLGRFLRAWSLDELPQLLNVLAGQMSLVGPRPHPLAEEGLMKEHRETILSAPPGLTGLWQVSGRNALSFDRRLYLEAWYVRNWSLWLDVQLLLRTVPVILFRRDGAV